jgi:hypothetical protein
VSRSMVQPDEVLFLHGLESGPSGSKATYLRQQFGGETADLDTRQAIASHDRAVAAGRTWDATAPDIEDAFAIPLQRAREALRAKPRRLLIGSSFGGAVLMRLIDERLWPGPSLFLAQAALKLTGHDRLPPDHRAIFIHGRTDSVVPLEHSRTIVAASGPSVQLWEVGDEHRLATILQDGTLDTAIQLLLRSAGTKP